jgi:nucleoside-diphosphate-sugar epimerase
MRILVTGADGFIGSYLTKALEGAGHEVRQYTIKDGDIAAKNALDGFDGMEYVYHLAARTFVPDSWDNTHEYFQTNIMGTITVLEYCRKNHCPMTMMSTYVYGEPQYLPVDEAHPITAVSPYHESKIACEELCRFYSRQFNMKITILRPFNVYGKGQSPAFLLPKIFYQVLDPALSEVTVMDLSPKRDYVYIDDVVAAIMAALKAPKQFSIYNVGSGISTSVEEAIQCIFIATGITKPYKALGEEREGEISDCIADIKSIQDELNFKPVYSLENGIKAWREVEKR